MLLQCLMLLIGSSYSSVHHRRLLNQTPDQKYFDLILDHKNASQGMFNTTLGSTGNENEDNPSANTYSIIGQLANNATYRDSLYLDDDGTYTFKLVYRYWDNISTTDDVLIWKQSSWPNAATVPTVGYTAGFEAISGLYDASPEFRGLGPTDYPSGTYLDGNANQGSWWSAVGAYIYYGPNGEYDYSVPAGIPGYNSKVATSSSLYVLYQATFSPTSDPTTNPTDNPTTYIDDKYFDLILDHKNASNGMFNESLRTTGLENENDPTANTYSRIGQLTNNATYRDLTYLDHNSQYTFKLIFRYHPSVSLTDDVLIWKQSEWPPDATVSPALTGKMDGLDIVSFPSDYSSAIPEFRGLGISDYPWGAWLDGNANGGSWWNAVGVFMYYGFPLENDTSPGAGIPGWYQKVAYSESLYILNLNTNNPTNDPTNHPAMDPTIDPTAKPSDGDDEYSSKANMMAVMIAFVFGGIVYGFM